MKKRLLLGLMLAAGPLASAPAQVSLPLDVDGLEAFYAVLSDTIVDGRHALHLRNLEDDQQHEDAAVAFFRDAEMSDGVIEVDIASERFAGIAFRGLDGDHYDKVYFRPFNSGTERHDRTVQYASPGTDGADWLSLREKFPGEYEAGADVPVWQWFRARLVVEGQRVSVFVGEETTPVLVVDPLLSGVESGRIGIWGWDVYFSDFTYTPAP